jgi:hypothetical protein
LNAAGSGTVTAVSTVVIHASFDPRTFENDIALLTLEKGVSDLWRLTRENSGPKQPNLGN